MKSIQVDYQTVEWSNNNNEIFLDHEINIYILGKGISRIYTDSFKGIDCLALKQYFTNLYFILENNGIEIQLVKEQYSKFLSNMDFASNDKKYILNVIKEFKKVIDSCGMKVDFKMNHTVDLEDFDEVY